jgi:histone acetyltransferase (RNA polymerase elongator complex component)
MMLEGSYQVLSLEETIHRCKELVKFFENHNIKILRLGLHPSEGLISGCEMTAGPFHPALKELVMTALWEERFSDLTDKVNKECIRKTLIINVPPSQINAATGHKASNKRALQKNYKKVVFKADPSLSNREFHAYCC